MTKFAPVLFQHSTEGEIDARGPSRPGGSTGLKEKGGP